MLAQANQYIQELEEKIAELEEKVEQEKGLNVNLLRIMKERANQRRGIRPKKAHDGYLALYSQQRTLHYKEEKWDTPENKILYNDTEEHRAYAKENNMLWKEHKSVEVWKTIVQTPYDVSLPVDQILDRIEYEITAFMNDVHITARLDPADNGNYKKVLEYENADNENIMYRWGIYRANMRSGFWEIEIHTTDCIQVPRSRMPLDLT